MIVQRSNSKMETQCPRCSRHFESRNDYRRHIVIAHPSNRGRPRNVDRPSNYVRTAADVALRHRQALALAQAAETEADTKAWREYRRAWAVERHVVRERTIRPDVRERFATLLARALAKPLAPPEGALRWTDDVAVVIPALDVDGDGA